MSYLVLARKWRPRTFDELAGQEHVVRALTHALDHDRLHHAYLFTGTRGVGKTTLARIFAKALNCEKGVSSTPCGQCRACEEVDAGRFIDLIEVDAASRTRVEDTRELLENVQYTPTRGRYKIYLIDEVHMLSTHSFNALLKTLEEPPPHVKFLLATTDPQKLPVTVLSRCLQFNLKSLPPAVIAQHLHSVLQAEAIDHDQAALHALAASAKGSVRDALSLLDQAIAFGAGKVMGEDVRSMLGDIGHDKIFELLQAIVTRQSRDVLRIVDQAAQIAVDFEKLLGDLVAALHKIALMQHLPEPPGSDDSWQVYSELARQMSAEEVQLFYQIALFGHKEMDLSFEPRLCLEMILLRMLAFVPELDDLPAATPAVPAAQAKGAAVGASGKIPPKTAQGKPATEPSATAITPQPPMAVPQELTVQAAQSVPQAQFGGWSDMVAKLPVTALTRQLAEHCVLREQNANNIELVLSPKDKLLYSQATHDRLQAALHELTGKALKLRVHIEEQSQHNPAVTRALWRKERQQAAVDAIMQDSVVHELMQTFDAKIAPDSIKPIDPAIDAAIDQD